MKHRVMTFVRYALLASLFAALAACSGGGSSSGGGNARSASAVPGNLAFQVGSDALRVSQGAVSHVRLMLQNSQGLTGERVEISTDDPSVLSVFPKVCSLSSNSGDSTHCILQVRGALSRSTVLRARSETHGEIALPIIVGAATTNPTWTKPIAVGSDGTAITTVNYPTGASNVAIKFELAPGYANIPAQGNSPAISQVVLYNSASVAVAQCALQLVDGQSPSCYLTVSNPGNGGSYTPKVIYPVGTVVSTGDPIALAPSATMAATNGTISIHIPRHGGNNIPIGMKAPVFVELDGGTFTFDNSDRPIVSLEIVGDGVAFYSFNRPATGYSGIDNVTPNTFANTAAMPDGSGGTTSIACDLNNPATGTKMSCGYGVMAIPNSSPSTVQIVAHVRNSRYSYDLPSITVSTLSASDAAVANAVARKLTFNNLNTGKMIGIGVVGGTAISYTGANIQTPLPTSDSTKVTTKGAGQNACGPNVTSYNDASGNPVQVNAWTHACPMGSSCLPGGKTPTAQTQYYCYWDQPKSVNGATLTPQTNVEMVVNSYSQAPGNNNSPSIYWSGNAFAQTALGTNGNFRIGTCSSALSAPGCAPGAGAANGMATLAEMTLQKSATGPDYYDVSLINGATSKMRFYPNGTNTAANFTGPSSSNAYACAVAGNDGVTSGTTVNNSVFSQRNYSAGEGLGLANWTSFNPNFSAGANDGPAAIVDQSYFRLVDSTVTGGGAACTVGGFTNQNNPGASAPVCYAGTSGCGSLSSSCTGGLVCGLALSDMAQGAPTQATSSAPFTGWTGNNLVCGQQVAWLSGDQIASTNQNGGSATPGASNNFSPVQQTTQNPGGTSWMFSAAISGTSSNTFYDLQLCNNNTYSGYTKGAQTSDGGNGALACGGVNYVNVASLLPSGQSTTYGTFPTSWTNGIQLTQTGGSDPTSSTVYHYNENWYKNVFPTLYFLKKACPTCYTYAFDDEVSTFTCQSNVTTSQDVINYTIDVGDLF